MSKITALATWMPRHLKSGRDGNEIEAEMFSDLEDSNTLQSNLDLQGSCSLSGNSRMPLRRGSSPSVRVSQGARYTGLTAEARACFDRGQYVCIYCPKDRLHTSRDPIEMNPKPS